MSNLSVGGVQRVVSNLSFKIGEKNETELLLFSKKNPIMYPFNGKIRYLDTCNRKNIFSKIIIMYRRVQEIKKEKQEENVVVISFLEIPNVLNILARTERKTIISVRNYASVKFKNGISGFVNRLIIKFFYNKADKIIAVSQAIKIDLIENFNIDRNKIEVIHNSYAIEKIEKMCVEQLTYEEQEIFKSPVVITSGRLADQKGQWHLIRSFKKIKKECPDAKLIILGVGPLKEYLHSLTCDLGLKQDVHFLGFQENPFKYIAKSEVFVFPSLFEGFPNSLAEAMICNIPVISSDCLSGPRELLAPEEVNKDIHYGKDVRRYGILLPVCDGTKYDCNVELTKEEMFMANEVIGILKNKDEKEFFKCQAKKRIYDFHEDNLIKKWECILELS